MLVAAAFGAVGGAGPRRHLHGVRVREHRQPLVEQRGRHRHQRRRDLHGRRDDGQHGGRRRARPARRHGHHHLHRPDRDDDRRLHADAPAHLPQRSTGRRHPPALRDLQARRHRVRRRGPLRERDARPPGRRRLLVRLSREQRRRAEEHGPALELPGARGLRRDATTLQIAVGCFNGSVNTACTVAGGGEHLPPDLRRPGRPLRPDRAGRLDRGLGPARRRPALGLRPDHARRQRQRRDPARRDPRRHRRAARASSASEDYATGTRTDIGANCSYAGARPARTSRTRPCARPAWPPGRGR